MSLDITPMTPAGRQIIQAYGEGAFRVNGVDHEGSVLVFLDRTVPWSGAVDMDGLKPVLDSADKPDILVVGCGDAFTLPPQELRDALKAQGVVLEWMDTAAACRTFNVLAIEERAVAAALIAVD